MTFFSRRDLRDLGVADGEIRSALRSGAIESVRRGFYVSAGTDDSTRHLTAVRAAMAASSADLVVSHGSAAAVHGFDQWPNPDERVHLTVNRSHGGRKNALRVVHASVLHPDDIADVDGLRVTSPARTVVDLACAISFESAVCMGDSALRTLSRTDLDDALTRGAGRRGIDRARRAAAAMDGRSESVGESRSRVMMHRAGLPSPRLQCTLLDERGAFVARPISCSTASSASSTVRRSTANTATRQRW